MRIHVQVDQENDQVYLGLGSLDAANVLRTAEIAPDIYADFDDAGHLVGIDIGRASQVLADGDLGRVSVDQLVGVKEAASMIGVKKSNFIRDYANKAGFPAPVVELASGRIWLRSQIEAYLRAQNRGSASSLDDSSVKARLNKHAIG